MYILNTEKNELISAENSSFKELELKERQHLQEWIAKEPSVLKENLLIIQKEFDGFCDTSERLDLLALDKNGNIVVIENKLDDSGKDLTWQAIKYASYCSSLLKDEIIDIYSKYIRESKEAAEKRMLYFFEVDDLNEIDLNNENTQRIIFVAANYRKEITSSVLWLRGFGIDVSCIKVSPFKYNGKVMVDFDKIIPVVEAEEYTIKMAEKKKSEAIQSAASRACCNERSEFWKKFIEYNQAVGGAYASSVGTPDKWLGKGGIGISGVSVNIGIGKDYSRIVLYFSTGVKDNNKCIYDSFFDNKEQLEEELGTLLWERNDDHVTCSISQSKAYSYMKKEDHQKIFEFFVTATSNFIKAFGEVAKKYKK